jgi:hypothetical protein
MHSIAILIISAFSSSALANSSPGKEEILEKAAEARKSPSEVVVRTCEDMKARIMKRTECGDEQTAMAKIDCSANTDAFGQVNTMFKACSKKRKFSSEEKAKMREALANFRSKNREMVKCEAFDERGTSVASMEVLRKDCRAELRKKFEAEKCKPGQRSEHKFTYNSGTTTKQVLTIYCKK